MYEALLNGELNILYTVWSVNKWGAIWCHVLWGLLSNHSWGISSYPLYLTSGHAVNVLIKSDTEGFRVLKQPIWGANGLVTIFVSVI